MCGARQVDGLLPQAVDPMCCLPVCRDLGIEDPQREFEEHVVAFLNAVKVSSVADALASVPDCSSTLAKLSFGQCLTRLQTGLKAVRESSLTAAEEVDVFTPLWWIAGLRCPCALHCFPWHSGCKRFSSASLRNFLPGITTSYGADSGHL